MPSDSKTLLPETIHIWTITLECPAQKLRHYENLLSTDEIDRANRFTSTVLKNRFVACRGKLREILATYVAGIAPEKLILNINPFGKPYLPNVDGIHFSYANSADIAMLAITHNKEVGIDLEQHTHVDINAIAERFFSKTEIAKLQGLPDAVREQLFFKIWVRKESYMKALGTGFNNLPSKEFSVLSNSSDQRTVTFNAQTATGTSWKIKDIDAADNFYAAVCGAGSDWQYLYMNDYSIR